jgi:small ligand-binding sensory domain FIST
MAAASFEVRVGAGGIDRLVSTVERELAKARRPSGLLIFCSGALARQLSNIGGALARVVPSHVPILLASGAGVLSERGEIEADSAATGLLVDEGRPEVVSVERPEDGQLMEFLKATPTHTASVALVRSELVESNQPRWTGASRALVLGGGTIGDPGIVIVAGGRVRAVGAAVLRLTGLRSPSLRVAQGCRLLGEPEPITRRDGTMLLELGGDPALGVLKERARNLDGRPVILAMLSAPDQPNDISRVRAIVGVDPDRRGIVLGPELEGATHAAFCVRDGAAARANLESACRALRRDVAGAAPRFGIYINGGGRGRSLHGSPDVDTRVIRESFPRMPLVGFVPAFEIIPGPASQVHSGVLCVVSSPS